MSISQALYESHLLTLLVRHNFLKNYPIFMKQRLKYSDKDRFHVCVCCFKDLHGDQTQNIFFVQPDESLSPT